MPDVSTDRITPIPAGTCPDFGHQNPILRLSELIARTGLAAERQAYLTEHTHYLFPFDELSLFEQGGADVPYLEQIVHGFRTADTYLMRGWATAGEWTGPFLRVSYRGGPDSLLSEKANHQLGPTIKLWLKVRDRVSATLFTVPYNPATGRYDLELWGFRGNNLHAHLDDKGRAAVDRGELLVCPELLPGSFADFANAASAGRPITQVATDSVMHPVLPLPVQLGWCDLNQRFWDSQDGANYRYEFSMALRGWDHFLEAVPHLMPMGGLGVAHHRTLFTNYLPGGLQELSRPFPNSNGEEAAEQRERGMRVERMDLVVAKKNCAIGLHRHRDNHEALLVLDGEGLVVTGDWRPLPARGRCFEARMLRPGHMVLLQPGQLFGFVNTNDGDTALFVFGAND
jgi:mannose-6-phosphate isomerase-like protein (cupin superfamily)